MSILTLGALEKGYVEDLKNWRNDLMVSFRQFRPLNSINQEDWITRISREDKNLMLAVLNKSAIPGSNTNYLVGVVGLCYVDWVERFAEASIIIGPEYRGKGYGEWALKALCNYGFVDIGLHRIWAEIFSFNKGSIKLFEKIGFKHEGVAREKQFAYGRYHDSIMMGLLEKEWFEVHERPTVSDGKAIVDSSETPS